MTEFHKDPQNMLPDVEDIAQPGTDSRQWPTRGRIQLILDHYHERFEPDPVARLVQRIVAGAHHPEEGILKPREEINPPDVMP